MQRALVYDCASQQVSLTAPVVAPSSFAAIARNPKTPQQCQALANKIDNILKQIVQRQSDLNTNPGNFIPGRYASTVQGHQELLGKYIQDLANAANDYNSNCGGGPPGAPTNGSPAPSMPPIIVPPIMPMAGEGGITLGEILEWLAGGALAF